MRCSSSELLLEATNSCPRIDPQLILIKGNNNKKLGARRRKLLELGFPGSSRRRPPRRNCRERFNFYATSALAFVATSGGAALLFLVPLYVDPALSTLAADFSPEPVLCSTFKREEISGLFNCTWSSCREGCTSDVYHCTHIYVTYEPKDNQSGDVEAVLLVNVKGCGYPPLVDCENFTREFGLEGAKFPCYYSRVNRSIVMADYNRETHVAIIMHFFAAPFVVTLATSVALCVMHCDCRCDNYYYYHRRKGDDELERRHHGNDLSDHSISNRVDRRGQHHCPCECGQLSRPL